MSETIPVSIRMLKSDKERLAEVAGTESRTFAMQVKFILHEWLDERERRLTAIAKDAGVGV